MFFNAVCFVAGAIAAVAVPKVGAYAASLYAKALAYLKSKG